MTRHPEPPGPQRNNLVIFGAPHPQSPPANRRLNNGARRPTRPQHHPPQLIPWDFGVDPHGRSEDEGILRSVGGRVNSAMNDLIQPR